MRNFKFCETCGLCPSGMENASDEECIKSLQIGVDGLKDAYNKQDTLLKRAMAFIEKLMKEKEKRCINEQ